MVDQNLLTPEEVGRIFGMSPKTIRDWCRSGQIKAVKVGRAGLWRVPQTELERLVKQNVKDLPKSDGKPARKIAIALSKGGVGKTTTAVNLAGGIAHLGKKVLIVDTDTQGQVSTLLGVKPDKGLAELLTGKCSQEEAIFNARENLDLICGGDALAAAKMIISKEMDQPQFTLAQLLEGLEDSYDFVIIDTAPSWDILNLCVLFYADEVLVPISLEILSIQGLTKFQDNLQAVAKYQQNLSLKYILPTFLDRRVKRSEEILTQLQQVYNPIICEPIHYNSKLAEAPAKGQTIFEYDSRSTGAKDYRKLVERVLQG